MNKALINSHGIKLISLVEETSRVYIWKATQSNLDRSVFLIILKEEPSADARETDYFLRIARLFAKQKSESLAAIFDIVSEDNLHYAIMEHVEGRSLDETVREEGPLPISRVLQIATSVAGALRLLWNNSRVIHRNLKGSTVRFDTRGIAKLTDFSLAVIDSPDFDPDIIDKGHVLGAPSFLSPEHAGGEVHLSVQSDMYSLGALLYYIATGKAPFGERSAEEILSAHISESITPPHRIQRDLPVDFSRLLHKLMVKDPAYRYQNWEEVHHDLHCLMDGREPVCAHIDLSHLSTIEADFSLPAAEPEEQSLSFRIKTKKRNEYLAGIQDQHVSKHHEADKSSTRKRQQFVLWCVLSVWLIALFWFRAVIQHIPEKKAELLDVRRKFDSAIEFLKSSETDAVKPAPETETPESPPRDADTVGESAGAAEPAPMPQDVLDSLAASLGKGDIAAAITKLSDDQREFSGKQEILSTLKKLPGADQLVAKHLAKNLGRPLIMNYKGTPRKVVPRAVNNNTIQLEANGKLADFNISDLSAEQKSNWMDPPQTREEHIVFCVLLLQSPMAGEASKHANNCGVLAPVILKASRTHAAP